MNRYIHLSDSQGRDAEIVFSGFPKKSAVRTVTADGAPTHTVRIVKAPVQSSYEALLHRYGKVEALSAALVDSDPELDPLLTGRIVKNSGKLYIDSDGKPAEKVQKREKLFAPDGTLREERACRETMANIMGKIPVRPSGKWLPKKELYKKLVFTRKYQLGHVNGLTFGFLYELAKELHERKSLILLAAGEKGNEPLVFQDGGKSYRAFLEGRIRGESYLLVLHLSDMELKALE